MQKGRHRGCGAVPFPVRPTQRSGLAMSVVLPEPESVGWSSCVPADGAVFALMGAR